MAPCNKLTFEECLKFNDLTPMKYDTHEAYEHDANLICGAKSKKWVENFSSASAAIVVYLICKAFIQIAECQMMLKKSRIWKRDGEHYDEARKGIIRSSIINLCFWTIVYIATSSAIQILASPLDRRANNMVIGLSQLFAGVVFVMMSITVPSWLGTYHSNKNMVRSATSSKEIQANLSYNMMREMVSMYFFNMFFSCEDVGLAVLWGGLIGLVAAVFILVFIGLARLKYREYNKHISIALGVLLGFVSWFTVANGIYYILDVWKPTYAAKGKGLLISFAYSCIWMAVIVAAHVACYFDTKSKLKMGKSTRFTSQVFRPSNVTDLTGSNKLKEKSTLSEVEVWNDGGLDQNGNNNNIDDVDRNNENGDGNKDDEKPKEITHITFDVEDDLGNSEAVGGGGKKLRFSTIDTEHIYESEIADEGKDSSKVTQRGYNKRGSKMSQYVPWEEAPSYWKMFATNVVMTYELLPCCCLKKYHVDRMSVQRIDFVSEQHERTSIEKFGIIVRRVVWYVLSFFFFFMTVINIGASFEQCKAQENLADTWVKLYPENYQNGTMCAWDKNGPPGPNSDIRTFNSTKDVEDANYEIIHCGACGACSNWNDIQLQYTSRKVLAGITKICAKRSLGKKMNLTALLQYSYGYPLYNRRRLDDNNDNDIIVDCNADLVGFTIPCSQAWAWDEIHTKGLAVFTFLQSQLTNAFADMEVTFQDITSATIDESLSGPYFVPWVGATRRRMNIISDIQRPDYQQCTVATQNWTEVFNDTFYPPVGGTYVIQSPGKPPEKYVVKGQRDD